MNRLLHHRALRAFVLLLCGLAVLAPAAWAPQSGGKPEKGKVGTPAWITGSDLFSVPISVKFGVATAGENAGFTIVTSLTVTIPSKTIPLPPVVTPVQKVPNVAPDTDGMVPIVPPQVPWDRDGGTYSGPVDLGFFIEFRNPDNITQFTFTFEETVTVIP